MANILFKPVCSNCGEVLKHVSYKMINDFLHVLHDRTTPFVVGEVLPIHCPNCGERFETIIIPKPKDSCELEYSEEVFGGDDYGYY